MSCKRPNSNIIKLSKRLSTPHLNKILWVKKYSSSSQNISAPFCFVNYCYNILIFLTIYLFIYKYFWKQKIKCRNWPYGGCLKRKCINSNARFQWYCVFQFWPSSFRVNQITIYTGINGHQKLKSTIFLLKKVYYLKSTEMPSKVCEPLIFWFQLSRHWNGQHFTSSL